ncbi:ribonuclease H-like domain-containing protein [Tanacetum coccineum]
MEKHLAPPGPKTDKTTDAKSLWEAIKSRSSSSTPTSQNLAFLSSENTSSTNEVSTASGDFGVSTAGGTSQVPSTPCAHDVAYSFFAQPTTSPQLKNEIFQQIDRDDLEELDLRWQVAMLTVRVKKFIQRTGRNMDFKEKRPVSLDKSKIECYNCHRKGHFARECRFGRNQRRRFMVHGRAIAPTNESSSQALVALDAHQVLLTMRSSDEESTPVNDMLSKADGYHAVPPPITGNFLTPRADISFAVYESVNRDKVIIEDWNSDDEDDVSEVQTVSLVKTNES